MKSNVFAFALCLMFGAYSSGVLAIPIDFNVNNTSTHDRICSITFTNMTTGLQLAQTSAGTSDIFLSHHHENWPAQQANVTFDAQPTDMIQVHGEAGINFSFTVPASLLATVNSIDLHSGWSDSGSVHFNMNNGEIREMWHFGGRQANQDNDNLVA